VFAYADIGASRGDAVLALLERAQVPPVPPFYKLCYDYLAGAQTLDAKRAGAILEAPQGEATAEAQLYADFVEPYVTDESVGQAIAQMLERMQVLEKMIVETQEVSRAHAVALEGASAGFAAKILTVSLMREWIARLAATNAAMRATNAALSVELEQTAELFVSAADEMRALSRESTIDPLTRVSNRAGLDQALGTALADAISGRSRLVLAVVDIDHFKRLNDSYGHQAGDEILRLVGRALVSATRSVDVVGRLGGDEFVVIFGDEDMRGAMEVAERVRRGILDCDVTRIFGADVLGGVTASIGVAAFEPGDTTSTLFERADRRLFEAKDAGRNKVVGEPSMLHAGRNAA
jgi:diguanylate cyclase